MTNPGSPTISRVIDLTLEHRYVPALPPPPTSSVSIDILKSVSCIRIEYQVQTLDYRKRIQQREALPENSLVLATQTASYLSKWQRHCRFQRQPVTSPGDPVPLLDDLLS